VRRALHETGLSADSLELEITEGALMVDPKHAANVLSILRADGIRVAIDDFGTGYSSLTYFEQFRFDRIKIDRTFVAGLGCGGPAEAIAVALIAICKALNVEVIAEGVENEAHKTFLTQHRCIDGQGFYYSGAVTPAVIADMLTARSILNGSCRNFIGPSLRALSPRAKEHRPKNHRRDRPEEQETAHEMQASRGEPPFHCVLGHSVRRVLHIEASLISESAFRAQTLR
jgi:hypothetical protein